MSEIDNDTLSAAIILAAHVKSGKVEYDIDLPESSETMAKDLKNIRNAIIKSRKSEKEPERPRERSL